MELSINSSEQIISEGNGFFHHPLNSIEEISEPICVSKKMYRCSHSNNSANSLPTVNTELESLQTQNIDKMETIKSIEKTQDDSIEIFKKLHKAMTTGIIRSLQAQQWLDKRKLSKEKTGACYSSGQVHHGKEQSFRDELESIGYLKRADINRNHGIIVYRTFGKNTIIFPIKNENNETINFYSIPLEQGKTEYLNNEGIYPNYPKPTTEKLIIVPTILDAATILESQILKENQSVISLFEGEIKEQHVDAIKKLNNLKEIIFIEKA